MAYLLLGERPTVSVQDRPDLWLRPDHTSRRHSANRLRDYAGYSYATYMAVFRVRTNVVTTSGALWGEREKLQARARAATARWFVHASVPRLLGVVALGRRAATAAGYPTRREPLSWVDVEVDQDANAGSYVKVAYVPHPSGMCRWWNDQANVEAAYQFFSALREYAGLSSGVTR